MKRSGMERALSVSEEEIQRNIKNSLKFPQFKSGGPGGAIIICAAGPSLLDDMPLIKKMHGEGIPVCAVKGTAQILIENGIIPAFVVSMDGKENQTKFFTSPHPDIEYLIAGQSHPKVFESLAGFRVTAWHGEGKQYLPAGTEYVLGGTTTGSRAISLMWAKNFTVQHLFGFDCSGDSDGKTHVYDPPRQTVLAVYLGEKRYLTTGQLIYQYQDLLEHFAGDRRLTIFVHGNGMLAEAWALIDRGIKPNLALEPYRRAA